MTTFIKYLSRAHLNNMNIAAYESAQGVSVRAENVINGKSIGARKFDSPELMETWWDNVAGHGPGKLANAIESLDYRK